MRVKVTIIAEAEMEECEAEELRGEMQEAADEFLAEDEQTQKVIVKLRTFANGVWSEPIVARAER